MTTEEPTISTPWRSDPTAMTERIEAWCSAKLQPGAKVVDVTAPEGSGMSSEKEKPYSPLSVQLPTLLSRMKRPRRKPSPHSTL